MIQGEVIKVETDEKNNLRVTTRYIDSTGAVIQEGNTTYSFAVLPTLDEIEAQLDADIEAHCNYLIAVEFSKKLKLNSTQKNIDNVGALRVRVVGKKRQLIEAKLRVGNREIVVDETNLISSRTILNG